MISGKLVFTSIYSLLGTHFLSYSFGSRGYRLKIQSFLRSISYRIRFSHNGVDAGKTTSSLSTRFVQFLSLVTPKIFISVSQRLETRSKSEGSLIMEDPSNLSPYPPLLPPLITGPLLSHRYRSPRSLPLHLPSHPTAPNPRNLLPPHRLLYSPLLPDRIFSRQPLANMANIPVVQDHEPSHRHGDR